MSFTSHKIFLPRHHPYKKQRMTFNGKEELEMAPELLIGKEIFLKLKGQEVYYGKNKN